MTSKAEQRRRKKAQKALPALAPVNAAKRHRVRGRFAKDDDPRKTALEARERQFGGDDAEKAKDAASDPLLGCEIGYVMKYFCAPDRAATLWDVWQGLCTAERTYRLRYIGQTGDPKGANIGYIPDPMQTDQSMRVDMREPEERDRQAVANWMRWRGYLGMIDKGFGSRLLSAERGDGRPLWGDGTPTIDGVKAFVALRELAKVVASR